MEQEVPIEVMCEDKNIEVKLKTGKTIPVLSFDEALNEASEYRKHSILIFIFELLHLYYFRNGILPNNFDYFNWTKYDGSNNGKRLCQLCYTIC